MSPQDQTPPRPRRRTALIAGAAGLALVGGGGLLMAQREAGVPLTPVAPTPIAKLASSGAIAAKGEVKEIYGNTFILQDASGRTLVDTGPRGEGAEVVALNESVTAQGRFENGELHAALLTHANGRTTLLAPPRPRGPLDRWKDRIGLEGAPDAATLTAAVEAAGYKEVRIAGRGPHHVEVVAKGADGQDHDLRVGFDGRVEAGGPF